MLESALAGLTAAVAWPAVGYLFLGIALGIYFGAVPGLSGLTGMAILLPFTFGMEPVSAFSFLLGMYAVTTTSDSITAILIGVPAGRAAQATVLDGYPMAKRGEAARAFGAAFTCSAIGGVLGGLFMGLSIPIVQPLVLSFAKPELFMLGVLGLTMVGSLSGRSVLKGMIAAGIGLLLSQIGYAEQMAIPRYWFGTTYLLDGLPMVPVVLGLFSLPELVVARGEANRSHFRHPAPAGQRRDLAGVRDSFVHWWLLLRSSRDRHLYRYPAGARSDHRRLGRLWPRGAERQGQVAVRQGRHPRRHRAGGRQQLGQGRRPGPDRGVRHPRQRADGDPARRLPDPGPDARSRDADHQAATSPSA